MQRQKTGVTNYFPMNKEPGIKKYLDVAFPTPI